MKKILVAVLLVGALVEPAFAAKKPKQQHVKYNYRYRTPKLKPPKVHGSKSHAPKVPKTPAN